MPFQERAKKFEEAMMPISDEWGIAPAATLQVHPTGIISVPVLQDLWESSKESPTSGT